MTNFLILAHKECSQNKKNICISSEVGCFHCLKIFPPMEVVEYIDQNEDTAICPYCGIDSVLPESNNYKMSKEFLEKMNEYWF